MPRRKGRPRKVSTVTKQEYIDDGEEDKPSEEAFSGLFDETVLRQIVRVRVIRKEPNEGTVGYLEDPTLGEAEIFERWGGSTYLVQALDIKGAVKRAATVKIAGDPIFVSTTAEMQWRRSRGLPPVALAGAAAVTAPVAAPAMTMQEMLMFMQQQDERQRTAEREHQASLRRLELEAREKEKRDDEDRERRRAKDEEERDARRRRDQQEAEARQQQFMQQTITMLQQSNTQALNFVRTAAAAQPAGGNNLMDAVKTVVAIKEAFAGEGGDGEETPMNLLIKHGGEWISGLSNGIAGAVREIKAGGTSAASTASTRSAPMSSPNGSSPLALLPASHPINEKVETLVAKLAAKGLDPIEAMATIIDNVTRDVDKIPQQGRAAAPSNGEVKPFVQGPEGRAQTAPVPVALVSVPAAPSEPVKVYRHSFGR